MVSSVSSTSPPSSTTPVSPAVAAANKTLNMLLQSTDVTQALSTQSSSYIPPTVNQALSTLWALFNTNGSSTINQADVKKAVIAEGGKPSQANALWAQLDPSGNGSVSAEGFITNIFLAKGVASNMAALQAAVKTLQQKAGPNNSTDLLASFFADGGSGSTISDVGGGNIRFTLMDLLA